MPNPTEELFIIMKYSIPQDKLDKLVFRYLDMQYGDLEQVKAKQPDIIFKRPNSDSEYGIMGWEKTNILLVYYRLIEEISNVFFIEEFDSKKIIGRWVKDRYKLKVKQILQLGLYLS